MKKLFIENTQKVNLTIPPKPAHLKLWSNFLDHFINISYIKPNPILFSPLSETTVFVR